MFAGPVLGIVGGLLLAIAVFFFMRTRSFIGRAKEAKGTVIQVVYTRNSSSSSGGALVRCQARLTVGDHGLTPNGAKRHRGVLPHAAFRTEKNTRYLRPTHETAGGTCHRTADRRPPGS